MSTVQELSAALWPSPWPAEDGGPARTQAGPRSATGSLQLTAWRDAYATTMVVLRAPGEVFALRHTIGRRPHRDPSTAWVERIHPRTLEPLARSSDLPAGPFWPGGLAAHANGSLYVVHGRWCHRLSQTLEVVRSAQLPANRPHNSFVVLPDGTLVMKDLDRALRTPATLTALDPETLETATSAQLPEAAIARLSADGERVYAVAATTVWRLHWDGRQLALDGDWSCRYRSACDRRHSHGWDPVIAGGHVWFMDNGAHDYATTMRGAGHAPGAVRLHRVAVADAADHESVEISGRPHGTVTNPPLYDPQRRIAVAYDSGNGIVQAFRHGERLTPLWRRELNHAAHMVQLGGQIFMHDFRAPAVTATRGARALAHRLPSPAGSAVVRRALARTSGDDVVVLDIESGEERGRARVPSMFQSVLFPAPGFDRDVYWCTFSTLARLQFT